MGALLGKEKKEEGNINPKVKVTSKDKAVLDLKLSRDKLTKFQKKLEKDSVRLNEQARNLVKAGNKNKALMLLKFRKQKEKEVDNINNQLLNVFSLLETIEWESANIQALTALQEGTSALKQLHNELSLEDAERIIMDSSEAIEMNEEISAVLNGGQSNADEEAELEAEFELLCQDIPGAAASSDSKVTGSTIESVSSLPIAPTTKPITAAAPVTPPPVIKTKVMA